MLPPQTRDCLHFVLRQLLGGEVVDPRLRRDGSRRARIVSGEHARRHHAHVLQRTNGLPCFLADPIGDADDPRELAIDCKQETARAG